MKKYLATLPNKSEAHKKRFAFMVSGAFTLFIFAIWSLVTFGGEGASQKTIAQEEVGPIDSLGSSIAASLASLKEGFGDLKETFEGAVNYKTDYTQMRDSTLEIYAE